MRSVDDFFHPLGRYVVMAGISTVWGAPNYGYLEDNNNNQSPSNGYADVNHNAVEGLTEGHEEGRHLGIGKFDLIALNWHHVQDPLLMAIWIVVATLKKKCSIAKLLFHANRKFASLVPVSACLILAGLAVGFIFSFFDIDSAHFTLSSDTFFIVLLPPIIFCAAYVMSVHLLFDNLDSVFCFAFFGTIFNAFAIGAILLYFSHFDCFTFHITVVEAFLFGTVISAVDPIAVVAIFEQIHINDFIFINVFGEALFNDGTCLVLYLMFVKFHEIGDSNIRAPEYIGGVLSVGVIILGGMAIGLFFGFLASFITKYSHKLKLLAPSFIFIFPYIAYLTAEMLEWSAILALITSGMVLKEYVSDSLSYEAGSAVEFVTKFLADCSETVIFLFLGLSTLHVDHGFDWVFIVVTIISCFVIRAIGVLIICGFLNLFRYKKFTFRDQFILSYSGLRGAMAYGLVVSLPASVAGKNVFVTTTIAMIYFTVFIQGTTMKSLLKWLHIEKKDGDEDRMFTIIGDKNIDFTMAGVEAVVGRHGRNFIREKIEHLNARWLKPIFTSHYHKRRYDDSRIRRAYGRAAVHDAIESVDRGFSPVNKFASYRDGNSGLKNVVDDVLHRKYSQLAEFQGLPRPDDPQNEQPSLQRPRGIGSRVYDASSIFSTEPSAYPMHRELSYKFRRHSSTFIN